MSRVRSHPLLPVALVLLCSLVSVPFALGQTCGVTGGGSTQMPAFTDTSFGLTSTAGGNQHLYIVTGWGIARFSLANPAAPSGGNTGMIGINFQEGSAPTFNGGRVPITTDSHQGATWFSVAESSDGSARVVSDWSPALNQGDPAGLQGQVVMASGNGPLSFGQQLNVPRPLSSGQPNAVASIGGAFYSFTSTPSGIAIANVTSPTGNAGEITPYQGPADPAAGIQPIGSFNAWGPMDTLTVANVTVGGLPVTLLVGTSLGSLHVGTINGNGSVTSNASVALSGGFSYSVSVANVGNKAVVFSAEGSSGIRGYEFTGSALIPNGQSISGNYDYLVARGSYPSLILVAHKQFTGPMATFDTKWMLTGQTPVVGPTVQHEGSPDNYFGKWVEAVVAGNTAYLYRVGTGTPERNLFTTVLDVSCITADLTSPPTASATFVNKSAQSRSGVEATINYYGDRFVMTDASASGTPITRVDWDLNTAGTTQGDFIPDVSLGTGSSIGGSTGLVFPCDPNSGGNPSTGSACNTSVGLTATPGTASFKFGEKSSNVNGAAASAYFSPAVPFVMPQAKVANLSGGVLSVLSGDSADSTPTQGHPVSWSWSFSGGSGGSSLLPVAPIPVGSTSFSLTVGYEGGYTAQTSGTIVQTDFIPSFTMSPASVGLGLTTLLTNTSRKSPGTTITQTELSVQGGACPGVPVFGTILQGAGPYTLTAPSTAGTYCVSLRYTYQPPTGGPATAIATLPLTVVNAAIVVSLTANPTSVAPGAATNLTASVTGGLPPYSYAWDCNYNAFSGGGSFGAPNATTNACSWGISGSHTPAIRVTDSNTPPTVVTWPVTVNVTGGGGGQLSVSIGGPSTTTVGTPNTFFAQSASGGTGSYSYAWNCDFTPAFPSYNPGSSSVSCSYSSSGAKIVALKLSDTGGASTVVQRSVTVSGGSPGPGGLGVTVTGPATGSQNQVLTYTAAGSGGTGPYTYAWTCDYVSLAGSAQYAAGSSTKTCSYTSNGSHTVGVQVTDSTNGKATNTRVTNITGPALPSVAFTVAGGTVSGNTITVGLGQPVTFAAAEPNAASWGWDFGDGTGGSARSITKTYSTKTTYHGQLIVTGNGTGSAGMNIAAFNVVVVTPAPSGAFTITGAVANSNGTTFTANVGDPLVLTASEKNAISYSWDFGDGTSATSASPAANKGYGTLGSYTVRLFVVGNERDTTGTVISTFTINVVSCVANATTLCLNDNRFRATVAWAVPDQGRSGEGSAVALTGDTGYYWFFSPTNIELVLKVVDGRAFNGNFWVFYGALSDVQYDISIKDTTTGIVKTYHNPYHTTASVADVDAFPAGSSSAAQTKKPQAAFSVACTPSTVTVGQPISCTASPAGTYAWDWGSFPPSYAPGPNPNTHTYTTVGTQRVAVTTDNGITVASTNVAVVASGGGGISPVIGGPSTGTTAAAINFTGSATGGTAPYSYAWNCDYSALTPTFTDGASTTSCSYPTIGVHTIGLKVTDSSTPPASGVATASITISAPAGPGLPSAAFTLSGALLNPVTNRYETEPGRAVTFTATETNAQSWGWDFGDGSIGGGTDPANRSVTYSYPQLGSWNGQLIVTGDGTHTQGLALGAIPISVLRCAGDAQTLCLNNGRFRVQVAWNSAESTGVGTAVPVTADTGQFWFITSNNIELVIKVVDGTSFNGHFWVFYGALSNLEYTITVTDTTTGTVKTYHNPLGTTASLADVNAF